MLSYFSIEFLHYLSIGTYPLRYYSKIRIVFHIKQLKINLNCNKFHKSFNDTKNKCRLSRFVL